MDFSLTDDQRLIRDTVRRFMEAEVRPNVRQNDREEKFAAAELRRPGRTGLLRHADPEEWGGAGADSIAYVLMLEEVARVDAAMAVALSVTNSVVAWPLYQPRHGSAAPKISAAACARRNSRQSFCLTEAQAGSDSAALQTRAVRDGDTYRLDGVKTWVTSGGQSGLYIVFAKTDPQAGARGVTAFLVEPSFPGFRVSRYEDKMGLRSSRSAEITLSDCQVPAENRLGEEGQGLKIALEALDGGRVGIAAQAVGIAQGALEAAASYAKQRRAFGKTIGEFQAIQWMLADMQTEIEAARGSGVASRMAARHRRGPSGGLRLASETLCQRNGEPRRLQSGADSRQHGLFARKRRREDVPRRARHLHLRRHQRNPAHDHRPRSAWRAARRGHRCPPKEPARWRLPPRARQTNASEF